MSFICAVTGKVTQPGERMNKVIISRREKVYKDSEGNELGRGNEIVKEAAVSLEGMRILQKQANDAAVR